MLPWITDIAALWPLAVLAFVYAYARELSEHSRDGFWTTGIEYRGRLVDSLWLNSTPTAWRNKHNWRPAWLWSTVLVFLTDAEHFFQFLSSLAVAGIAWYALASSYPVDKPVVAALAVGLGLFGAGIFKELVTPRVR